MTSYLGLPLEAVLSSLQAELKELYPDYRFDIVLDSDVSD